MDTAPAQMDRAAAISLLGWWMESGVDAAVQEDPRDWLEAEVESRPPTVAPAATPPEPEIPETLDLFRDWLKSSDALPQARTAAGRVLPRGSVDAPIMILADSPSGDESAAGQPIAGAAWDLTVRMLAAIGIDAGDAYLANISCFHAPGQRMSSDELATCATIARRHVALARPKLLLLLGDGPSRALFGKPVASARGHVHKIEGVRSVVSFHPRLLVNRGSQKALAWKDLLLLTEEQS